MESLRLAITEANILEIIPHKPGVYVFRDIELVALYVGKAKDLKNRLSSYLRPAQAQAQSAKTMMMLRHAETVDFIITRTEKEALLLEASLIKEHRPRYNIVLRDDKAYPILRLDVESPFPRLSVVRRRQNDSALYFGPYPSGWLIKQVYHLISAHFKLRTCSDFSMKNRHRPCLKYQINRCSAPCVGKISQQAYSEQALQVARLLQGKSRFLINELRQKMLEAADDLRFEEAATYRDKIAGLEQMLEKQSIVADVGTDWDAIGICVRGIRAIVAVILLRDGVVTGQDIKQLKISGDESHEELLSAFLRQYYAENPLPKKLLLPVAPNDMELLQEWLSAGNEVVRLKTSRFSDQAKQCLAMAQKNAEEAANVMARHAEDWALVAEGIKTVLGLKKAPETIETVDISHTAGELSVGSLVAFCRGEPDKAHYRHYNIKTVSGIDDFAMIKEVVMRRICAGLENADLPDLLLIDGGKGQLAMALEAVKELCAEESVELASIAKERTSEGEKLYIPHDSTPVLLPRHHPALLFLQRMRDEAHRFGVSFHRKKRDKLRRSSSLLDIEGIGVKTEQKLLEHFGSTKRISQATVEELMQIKGVTAKLAERILGALKKG